MPPPLLLHPRESVHPLNTMSSHPILVKWTPPVWPLFLTFFISLWVTQRHSVANMRLYFEEEMYVGHTSLCSNVAHIANYSCIPCNYSSPRGSTCSPFSFTHFLYPLFFTLFSSVWFKNLILFVMSVACMENLHADVNLLNQQVCVSGGKGGVGGECVGVSEGFLPLFPQSLMIWECFIPFLPNLTVSISVCQWWFVSVWMRCELLLCWRLFGGECDAGTDILLVWD